MQPILPFELVENVLSRLPVKPLKRFRCVAKSWRSLIDSNRFVKLHLNMSFQNKSHRHLFVGDKNTLFRVDLDNEDPLMAKANVVKPPFSRLIDLSNSCNGLFLVPGKPLVLWNPFTNEVKNLPAIGEDTFPPPLGCYSKIFYGFGYDSKNDDYKVVRVVTHLNVGDGLCMASLAHIYSLKSNSWRETAEKYDYPVPYSWPADVNGALHTLLIPYTHGEGAGPAKIMAFSVESERHYEVKLPLGVPMKGVVGVSLLKIGGDCLSIEYTTKSRVEIWVMKDYGVVESWTKLLSIPISLTMNETDDDTVRPLVYSKDGCKVLMYLGPGTNFSSTCGKSKDNFFWHDLRNQTMVTVPLKGLPFELDYFDTCVESLVQLHGEKVHTQVRVHDKKEKKKIRNKRDDFLSTGFKLVL